MKFLHLTADGDGVSHFTERDIALELQVFAPPAQAMFVSEAWGAERLFFLTLPAGWQGDWHPSPKRQVAFCLSGRMMIEAGDGERREIEPGGIWLMEDTSGPGHLSRVISTDECRLAIVQLE